ncbi:radical SAM/SPASM domain-containing protein [Pseudobacteroides cellulosolvens]|uniref:Radical SAM domain protein n=1 Tax=Pseudobacteroides cellulosolvens ATCC 35603 = DSM 2933 TaxID=398512 RepID=A0A0L6JTA2_9FIRM|nr:radical SAM/SPASM domain-containing protein [Pseudobacteroides cellulosolvens]KNY28934.1 Radical SAM domain protein [Pseudobacteroides cellulosolvens ATCC 35603 = DSM 2933]
MDYHCLTLIYTTKCTAECDICCFYCSPKINEKMDLAKAKDYVDQAAKIKDITTIGIAGGEVFIYYDELLELVKYIKQNRMKVSCTTNGFWGTSEENALKIISEIKEAGLSYMKLSVDDFHEKFVPIDRIKNVLKAAYKLEYPISIGCTATKNSKRLKYVAEILEDELEGFSLMEFPCYPIGKARDNNNREEFLLKYKPYTGKCKEWHTITIMPDGGIYPCGSCCGTIPTRLLGNAKEQTLEELITKAENDPLRRITMDEGVKWFFDTIEREKLDIKIEDNYVDVCDACYSILNDNRNIEILKAYIDHN